jgi:hypothetical protein
VRQLGARQRQGSSSEETAMMIQNALEGEAHFISMMAEHNDLCGQFARAFGNAEFERLDPFEEMVFVVGHHDRGWAEWDAAPDLDDKTGMPCGLTSTPIPTAIETNRKSPDFNEDRHPYCGLLSSMHSWGLYNERYGFTAFRVRPGASTSVPIVQGFESETRAVLDNEIARQERLRAALAADPATRDWVEEKHLMQNYKQLQFFDTLALYFNLRHADERGEETYVHVPKSADEDASVTVRPQGDGVYAMDPFPFAGDRLEVACKGRYMRPLANGEAPADVGAYLNGLPVETQVHTFVAG